MLVYRDSRHCERSSTSNRARPSPLSRTWAGNAMLCPRMRTRNSQMGRRSRERRGIQAVKVLLPKPDHAVRVPDKMSRWHISLRRVCDVPTVVDCKDFSKDSLLECVVYYGMAECPDKPSLLCPWTLERSVSIAVGLSHARLTVSSSMAAWLDSSKLVTYLHAKPSDSTD